VSKKDDQLIVPEESTNSSEVEQKEAPAPKRRGRPRKPKPVIPFVSGIPEGQVVEVHLDDIDLDDTEFEFRVDHKIKDLVDDIASNGQQFPIILRQPREDGAKPKIVSGFRRTRAIRALGWTSIKAIVRDDLDDDEAYRLSYLENEKRRNLTGVDKAHAIVKLRMRGKTDDEIRAIYGIGQRQLDNYKRVSTFPQVLKDAVSEGLVPTTHALILMKNYDIRQGRIDLEEWIAKVHDEGLSVRKLTRDLNLRYGKLKRQKRYMERLRDGGFRLYPMKFDPKRTPPELRKAMLRRLKEAVERLEAVDEK